MVQAVPAQVVPEAVAVRAAVVAPEPADPQAVGVPPAVDLPVAGDPRVAEDPLAPDGPRVVVDLLVEDAPVRAADPVATARTDATTGLRAVPAGRLPDPRERPVAANGVDVVAAGRPAEVTARGRGVASG